MDEIIKIKDDILLINLQGEIDHHRSLTIRDQVDYYIKRYKIKKVLFNFKDVSFMDSSGVGMIIGRYKLLRKLEGRIGVVHLTEKINKIFEMSGLFNIVSSFNDVREALEKL
ncbi:MAG: anti-sigma F factor antagonist [Tepidanaerobacteraceae bacterium]|jgi:stage II sporulation protein AA (anti-sigma F factor antagonist)|nr:anti-sigma F factor antagonist [Thermoanaerobacterales bacterium]